MTFHYPVFTLQSIKSRIETYVIIMNYWVKFQFLLYSPLNQGLKQPDSFKIKIEHYMFLLYSPLNQGLKPKQLDNSKVQ